MGNSSVRSKGFDHDDEQGPTMTAKESLSYASDSDAKTLESFSRQSSFATPYTRNDHDMSRELPTVFRWDGKGKDVYISGSYDNWTTKIPLVKSRHDFFTIIDLPEGAHQFKYFVDGQWVCDEKEPTIPNSFGTHNNVVTVKPSDFEAFEALGVDSLETGHTEDNYFGTRCRPMSPPGDYCRIVPEKDTKRRHAPPSLPAHLLQIVLNQEVPKHCEPYLLPEPNHVMLNHLYCLSIKDGVMILSATHRYRKKYVTTVLYKPI